MLLFIFHIVGFCPLYMLWDSVLWDFVLWDFVRRDFVLWDSVPGSFGSVGLHGEYSNTINFRFIEYISESSRP